MRILRQWPGVLPLLMRHGGFYITWGHWVRFSSRYLHASFADFRDYKLRKYKVHNA